MTLRPSDLAGLLVAALLLLWLAFSAGRGCAPTRAPKPQTLPELKAQRATEQDVHEMRVRLAACIAGGRPAVYYSKALRRRRADREHDLCRRCWAAEQDRRRRS